MRCVYRDEPMAVPRAKCVQVDTLFVIESFVWKVAYAPATISAMSARTKRNNAFTMILVGLWLTAIGCATKSKKASVVSTQTQATTNSFTGTFDAAWRVIY